MENHEVNSDDIYWSALKNIYLKRKEENGLHQLNSRIAPSLIKFFYSLFPHPYFDLGIKNFKAKYILNETDIAHVSADDEFLKYELMGMAEAYKYIENYEFIDGEFTLFEAKELHKKLYSHAPYPEGAGVFRNHPAYWKNSGIELCEFQHILREFCALSDEFDRVISIDIDQNPDNLIPYIRESIILTTKLLKIHPFSDGNSRTSRALLNLMLKKVNIPPVYILPNEIELYKKGLKKALAHTDYNEENFESIITFFMYKICDSLVEITEEVDKSDDKTNDSDGVKIYEIRRLLSS